MHDSINHALAALKNDGVIAYPTEYCFGLGCDPKNSRAIQRILEIKQRQKDQGLILIAANAEQVKQYVKLNESPFLDDITHSWSDKSTRATTWTLAKQESVSDWISGTHSTVAVRITQHPFCKALCEQFGGAIISTSANRHGQSELTNYQQVMLEIGDEVDYIVDLTIGGAKQASQIRDGLTGKVLR